MVDIVVTSYLLLKKQPDTNPSPNISRDSPGLNSRNSMYEFLKGRERIY